MIDLHPLMSTQLQDDVESFYTDDECIITADSIMVRFYDELSDAVLRASEILGVPPRVVLEEWCVSGDWPEVPGLL